jgi:hypothetical protein
MKLRRGTRGILSNVVLSDFKTGIDVEHDETIAGVGTTLKATSVNFSTVPTKTKGKKTDGTSADVTAVATELSTATGAGNGVSAPTWASGWSVGL